MVSPIKIESGSGGRLGMFRSVPPIQLEEVRTRSKETDGETNRSDFVPYESERVVVPLML